MNVAEILKQKSQAVETVAPELPVRKAAERLKERNIGSLVVTDSGGHVLAILSERDIVRAFATAGPEAAELRVADVASRALVCTPDVDAAQAMRVMTDARARHVAVMVGDRLEGLISIGDIVHARLDLCQLEVSVLRDYSRPRGPAVSFPR